MNLFNRKPKQIDLRELCRIINEETLTIEEVAEKQHIGVRHVKRKVASGKLNPIRPKSKVLFIKKEIK